MTAAHCVTDTSGSGKQSRKQFKEKTIKDEFEVRSKLYIVNNQIVSTPFARSNDCAMV